MKFPILYLDDLVNNSDFNKRGNTAREAGFKRRQ